MEARQETTSELIVWDTSQLNFYRKLGNFVQYFQTDLPKNGSGIPMKYIDPTVMAQNILNTETTDDVTETAVVEATIPIDFDEGFPTICSLPFWERLDGEPMNYYKAFKQYREMKYITGIRAIAKLAKELNIPGKILNSLAKVYHWSTRCQAYDVYKEQIKQLQKQNMIESMESQHSKIANQLLTQSMEYLEKHPEQLNPKVALQMVQLGIKTGRATLGLSNADRPAGTSSVTNVQISNQPGASIGSAPDESLIDKKVDEKVKDPTYLQSILHILDKSGAFTAEDEAKAAIDAEVLDDGDDIEDPVE